MHFQPSIAFRLTLFLAIITFKQIAAAPAYNDIDRIIQSPVGSIDRLDDDYYISYDRPLDRQPKYLNSESIKPGYYYIDNGAITPVSRRDVYSGQRRQDTLSNSDDASNLSNGVKFTPLVRYKQTETRHKKLFVPNFFG
ncbi:uncharacterized protein LOC106083734 [Stomoxys calcitrans]|uniref:Uncharacterized protein n=1 Tax=Stomoxys calcitrans TaxID=35570 RepID=A0A1I8P0H2_STOCA|nr:uncharacterized protein LOC106083734 [Stomoxys calcitrans]